MKTLKRIGCCLSAGMLLVACSKDDDNTVDTSLNDQDRTFILMAALSNSAEDSAATIALNKPPVTTDVADFATHMVLEHSLAQANLKKLGMDTVGVRVMDSLDAAHRTMGMMMMSMPAGRSFDSAYIWSQVADHMTAKTMMETEIANGRQPNVKLYAVNNLPHINEHLAMAQTIATSKFPR